MPHYKLCYFNGRGRAELCRYIFAVADVEYEDFRFERDEWPKYKPVAPFGQAPYMEVDGVVLCQGNSMARFLAKRFALHGKTDLEEARIDMLVDCFEDMAKPLMSLHGETDEEIKTKKRKTFTEDQAPKFFSYLEKLLIRNNGGDGYFVGESLTWADLSFAYGMTWPELFGVTLPWEDNPKLKALAERVNNHPKIVEWVKKRPLTQF